MEKLRVLIVDMPHLLHDIVRRSVDECEDMIVVGSIYGDEAIDEMVRATNPAVIVIGATHPDVAESRCPRLLAERARTKLLAVADDGHEAFLHELRPSRTPLGELSPAALLTAIRSAAQPATP